MKDQTDNKRFSTPDVVDLSKRSTLKAAAVVTGAGLIAASTTKIPQFLYRSAYAAGSDKPIRVGFQVHRTGIGALYGRWYEQTTTAVTKLINEMGGIAGRPVEIVCVRTTITRWPGSATTAAGAYSIARSPTIPMCSGIPRC